MRSMPAGTRSGAAAAWAGGLSEPRPRIGTRGSARCLSAEYSFTGQRAHLQRSRVMPVERAHGLNLSPLGGLRRSLLRSAVIAVPCELAVRTDVSDQSVAVVLGGRRSGRAVVGGWGEDHGAVVRVAVSRRHGRDVRRNAVSDDGFWDVSSVKVRRKCTVKRERRSSKEAAAKMQNGLCQRRNYDTT